MFNTEFLGMACSRTQSLLVSAVRGADNEDGAYALKWQVTARIRAIVFDSFGIGDYNNTPLTQWHIDQVIEGLKNPQYANDSHYVGHLVSAIAVSLDNPIWGGLAQELVNTLNRVTA